MYRVQGMYYGGGVSPNKSIVTLTNTPLTTPFVTAYLRGSPDSFMLKGGDATTGALKTMYDGPRPFVDAAGNNTQGRNYQPAKKQGAIILATGGDNSNSAMGCFVSIRVVGQFARLSHSPFLDRLSFSLSRFLTAPNTWFPLFGSLVLSTSSAPVRGLHDGRHDGRRYRRRRSGEHHRRRVRFLILRLARGRKPRGGSRPRGRRAPADRGRKRAAFSLCIRGLDAAYSSWFFERKRPLSLV